MHPYLSTFIAAMTPIGELRLAIPLALAKFDLSITEAYIIAVLGNLVPVVFLLLFLEAASLFLIGRSRTFERFFAWLFARTRSRVVHKYEAYGYAVLVLFVAIPLPITGAWTGSAAAYLIGIPFWRAFGLIATGVMISGIVVTLASVGIISIF